MKRFVVLAGLVMFYLSAVKAQSADKIYDSALAKKLKADDYGMKTYVLVLLKSGRNTSPGKALSDSLFAGHMKNMKRLAAIEKLVVAGPFVKNEKYRGLFILDAAGFEEAKKLLETDPAIQGNLLEPELYLWYGSAALQATFELHHKIQKLEF